MRGLFARNAGCPRRRLSKSRSCRPNSRRIAAIFAILFFSKFVVLEVIDIVFGDTVELGQFIEVAILVVTLILVRLGVKLIYERLATIDYPRSREGGA